MSPTVRRLSIIAAAIVGFLVLLVLALPFFVSLDALRARVIAAAEQSLHRKVEIGSMRIQILSGPGARVEKVVVHNKAGFEAPALLSADRVSVKVAFWPLLSRRVEVRAIVLDGVTLTVERTPDGAMNIDDFLSAGKRESGPASQTAAAALLVSRIEIARGRAAFVDRKVTPGKTVTLALDDLTGRVTDIGPTTPARFDLAARFLADTGRNLTLKGTLGPPPATGPVGEAPIAAAFSAKDLALARLAPYVAAFQANDPGAFSIDGKVSGKLLGALELSGNMALTPAAGSSIPSVDGTFAAVLDWPKGTLAIGHSLFDVANLPLDVEGRIDDLHKERRVALRIGTPGDVELDKVTGLPGLAGRLPASVKLSGRVRVEAQIDGPAAELEMRGSADASSFGVSMDGQPLFAAPSVHATLGSHGNAPIAGRVTRALGNAQEPRLRKARRRLDVEGRRADSRSLGRRLRRNALRARGQRLRAPEVGIAPRVRRGGRAGTGAARVPHVAAQRLFRNAARQGRARERGPQLGRRLEDRAAAMATSPSPTPTSGPSSSCPRSRARSRRSARSPASRCLPASRRRSSRRSRPR